MGEAIVRADPSLKPLGQPRLVIVSLRVVARFLDHSARSFQREINAHNYPDFYRQAGKRANNSGSPSEHGNPLPAAEVRKRCSAGSFNIGFGLRRGWASLALVRCHKRLWWMSPHMEKTHYVMAVTSLGTRRD